MIDEDEVHGINKDTSRHKEQMNIYSAVPRYVSAEKRHGEALNQVGHQVQDCPSNHTVRTKQSFQGNPHRDIEAPQYSANSAGCRELGCASRHTIRLKTVNAEKRNMQSPKQIMQKPQKQHSCNVTCPEHAQPESANVVIHIQEKQQEPGNGADYRENECNQLADENIVDSNNKRRTIQLISLNARGAEKRQGQTTSDAPQQARKEQSDSVIYRELDNQTHVENDQPGRHRIRMRKRKGLIAGSNSGIQLRRSKRLANDLSAAVDRQRVMDSEQIHSQTVGHQTAAQNGLIPIAVVDDEQTESEPDEQRTASPVRNLSDLPPLCNSSSAWHEIPLTSSNELGSPHSATPPSSNYDMSNPEHFSSNPDLSNPGHFSSNPDLSNPEHFSSNPGMSNPQKLSSNPDPVHFYSNPDMSDPEHFARTYIPMDVRRALAKLPSTSLLHNMMSRPNYDESYLLDSMDSEGKDLQLAPQKRGRRPGHSTLCLKVWTMPKGMRIPVSFNASGDPIGKEATTFSYFLGTLARDGVLAPLTYLSWKRVPKKNKDVMCHIAKLKFDIAPVGELWIVKNLGNMWRRWKCQLKKQHFDTHETEEERLANRNPRVLEEQWRFLVAYWSTETAQAASARNKACQAKMTSFHTSGTKSFARLIEEEKRKRPNNDVPSVEDLFILTHTPKGGRPMTKATADAIARFREQCQKQTEGTGNDFGVESCPNGRRRRGKGGLKATLKEAMEAKRKAEDEAAALREKLFAIEETKKKLQKGKDNTAT